MKEVEAYASQEVTKTGTAASNHAADRRWKRGEFVEGDSQTVDV
jgi:hypothetical protein